jgi:hypothetical protein
MISIQKITSYTVAIVAALALAVGCGSRNKNICHVNPTNWSKGAIVAIDNAEVGTMLDVSFFVRHNSDFNLKTLPVIIRSIAPDGQECIDQTFWVFDGYDAAAPTAELQQIGYRSTCIFDQIGEYKFIVSPMEPVRGVEAIIINAEKFSY